MITYNIIFFGGKVGERTGPIDYLSVRALLQTLLLASAIRDVADF